jgi:hypothetical protein
MNNAKCENVAISGKACTRYDKDFNLLKDNTWCQGRVQNG